MALIGTAENCTFGSILDWANSTTDNSWACTISAYGYPTDAPTQNEAMLTLLVDTTGARKYVEYHVYAGDQHKILRRCIYGAAWNGDWFNIADGGNAATLENHSASDFALAASSLKWVGNKNTSNDCNDCMESGWYFFNGCGGHSPLTGTTSPSGTYIILEMISYPNNSKFGIQRATCVHGADVYMGKTYTRYLNNGVWSNWDILIRSSDITALEARIAALEAKIK